MNPPDFFALAESLKNRTAPTTSEEICLRTAINRLHYGIFHQAIITYDIHFITEDDKRHCHEIVGNRIRDRVDLALAQIYNNLEKWRNDADYDPTARINASSYRSAFNLKEELFRTITGGELTYIPPFEGEEEEQDRRARSPSGARRT